MTAGAFTALLEGSRALWSALRMSKRNRNRRLHGLIRPSEIAGAVQVVMVRAGALGGSVTSRENDVLFVDLSQMSQEQAQDVIAQLRIEGLEVRDER